jgi:hypothetical protein
MWIWVLRTLLGQNWCTPGQCPGATVILVTQTCRPANLNRVYNRNIADDTAVLATDSDPGIASQKLQTNPKAIQKWSKRWRIKANESKSVHVTFTTQRETCPPVHIKNIHHPQQDVEYLGLHLDRRLTWRKRIFTKRKQLGMTLTKMHWLLGRKSKLSTSNKILLYKAILKPIWTYGIQL